MNYKMDSRLAVFGGTFDPPHNGHVALAKQVLLKNLADKIIFVPTFCPPHKPVSPTSSFSDRIRMLELALSEFDNFEVSDIEGRFKNTPSYTFDTMTELENEYSGCRLSLLIGSDSLRQLHTWHKARKIVEKWPLIVYPRKNEIPSSSELILYWPNETCRKFTASLINAPMFEISSTEIRGKIKKGEEMDNLLKSDVLCYIKEKRLYL